MTKDIKEKIIREIAIKNQLIIDESDPIFAILVANEMYLEDYYKKLEQVNLTNLLKLETHYSKILDEVKYLAERKISVVIEEAKNSLEEQKNSILKSVDKLIDKKIEIGIKESNEKNDRKLILIYGVSIFTISLIVGIIIGTYFF